MARRVLSVVIDEELDQLLALHARTLGIERSGAVRDLLRRALGAVGCEPDAGWREGRAAAWAAVRRALAEAVNSVPPTAPAELVGAANASPKRKAR
jgi:hypothetical protein